MFYRLQLFRHFAFGAIFIASSIVLGLAANFASLFLPNIHRPFSIYSLIVPSVAILVIIFILQRSSPGFDLAIVFILDVMWLALAAWASDVIGPVECFSLGGQKQPTKSGTMSLQTYCYEMKAIEAFSWAVFGILLIYFIILFILTERFAASNMGRYSIWNTSLSELPWFGQPFGGYGGGVYPNMSYSLPPGAQVVQQMPGHSLVIQPGLNGQAQITQVPSVLQSV